MDARSLAMEMAPVIMWQKDRKPESYRKYWSHLPKSPSMGSMDSTPTYSAWDMLEGKFSCQLKSALMSLYCV